MTTPVDFATPGKTTPTACAQPTREPVPGKGSLVEHPTGISNIDDAGKPKTGSGFFLNHDQRAAVMTNRGLRINAVFTEMEGALGDVWADVTAENETELNPIVGIVLNILAGSASIALQQAVKYVMRPKAAEALLREAEVTGVEVGEAMSDVAETRLEVFVGASVDQLKETTKPQANAVTTATADSKTVSKSFLDMLDERAGDAIQAIRENLPDGLTDTDLLAEFERWNIKYHRRAAYREKFERMLARYKGSKASKLGRTNAPELLAHGGSRVKRELGVAWLQGTRRSLLAYIAQDFDVANSDYLRAGAYNATPMISLADPAHATDGDDKHGIRGATPIGRPMFMGWVEADMKETALAKHEAVWLQSPKTYTYDMLLFGGGKNFEVEE